LKKILVTGSAGFIGFHLVKELLSGSNFVIGIDNINNYYDPKLKEERLKKLDSVFSNKDIKSKYIFKEMDLCNKEDLENLFDSNSFDIVINLAAQAGVRYSLENPTSYINSNIVGFSNLLENCRHHKIKHFIFASSSSVYGMNKNQPFNTSDKTDFPISLYAATKKSNELLAFSYSHLFKIPSTGLRFFTVYGPYGRPDMAYYNFTKLINEGKEINVFNNGDMKRDFTYIDDIVNGIIKLINRPPAEKSMQESNAKAPFNIFNIGNNNPVTLRRFITAIESSLGKKAIEKNLPIQPGDVPITYADIDDLSDYIGFKPSTSIEDGISKFVDWYKEKLDHEY
tara:strand:- start:22206 stop:23225 length:1020 start_codon:yes stop_codon:yes gene_type:complete